MQLGRLGRINARVVFCLSYTRFGVDLREESIVVLFFKIVRLGIAGKTEQNGILISVFPPSLLEFRVY